MICSQCTKPNDDDAMFCESCGEGLPAHKPDSQTQSTATAPADTTSSPLPRSHSSPPLTAPSSSPERLLNRLLKLSGMRKIVVGSVAAICLILIVSVFGGKNSSGNSLQAVAEDHQVNWVLTAYSQAIANLKASKGNNSITISFDMDIKNPQIVNLVMTPKLLIRLFDKNDQLISHFTSAEEFTVSPGTAQSIGRSFKYTNQGGTLVLLERQANVIKYTINQRDLRDTNAVAIGFIKDK